MADDLKPTPVTKPQPAPPTDILTRLSHAIVTASNDDTSAPMTEARRRHAARIEAMDDAIEEIKALRLELKNRDHGRPTP